MKTIIPIIILLLSLPIMSYSQFTLNLDKGHSLHIQHSIDYDGAEIEIALPSFAAKEYTEKIVAFTGLPRKFKLVQSNNIQRAMAHFDGKNHYLIYNEDFFSRIKTSGYSDWPAIFVLVHEIGHLLIHHPPEEDIQKARTHELEADQFAGFGLNKLGATVQEALSYIDNFSQNGKGNHPSKDKRIKAITDGWNMGNLNAESVNGPCNSNEGSITFVNECQTRMQIYLRNERTKKSHKIILGKGGSETIHLNALSGSYSYNAETPAGDRLALKLNLDYPKVAGSLKIIPCKTQVIALKE